MGARVVSIHPGLNSRRRCHATGIERTTTPPAHQGRMSAAQQSQRTWNEQARWRVERGGGGAIPEQVQGFLSSTCSNSQSCVSVDSGLSSACPARLCPWPHCRTHNPAIWSVHRKQCKSMTRRQAISACQAKSCHARRRPPADQRSMKAAMPVRQRFKAQRRRPYPTPIRSFSLLAGGGSQVAACSRSASLQRVSSPMACGCTSGYVRPARQPVDPGRVQKPQLCLTPSDIITLTCGPILLPYNWRWRSHAVRLRPFPEATATRSLAGLIKTCGGRLTWISLSAARSHRAKRTIDLDSLCHAGRV